MHPQQRTLTRLDGGRAPVCPLGCGRYRYRRRRSRRRVALRHSWAPYHFRSVALAVTGCELEACVTLLELPLGEFPALLTGVAPRGGVEGEGGGRLPPGVAATLECPLKESSRLQKGPRLGSIALSGKQITILERDAILIWIFLGQGIVCFFAIHFPSGETSRFVDRTLLDGTDTEKPSIASIAIGLFDT